jgi:hypothetical protein
MAYTTAEARAELMDGLGDAVDRLGLALACLTEAYGLVDDDTADRLEEQLFRPVQSAYGRARRTYLEFASRHDLPLRDFEPQTPGVQSQGAKAFIERAVAAAGQAEQGIAVLQDSMLPVEAGDAQLRTGLTEIRELIDGLSGRARELLRTLGR